MIIKLAKYHKESPKEEPSKKKVIKSKTVILGNNEKAEGKEAQGDSQERNRPAFDLTAIHNMKVKPRTVKLSNNEMAENKKVHGNSLERHSSASDFKALQTMNVKPFYLSQMIDISRKHPKVKKHKDHKNSNKLQMVNKPTGVKGYQVKPTFNINTKNWPNQDKIRYDVPRSNEQLMN
jgi:hypothetical protein